MEVMVDTLLNDELYAQNCAKGAVFIQPCGWMGTYHLWSGAVSDTEYMINNYIRYITSVLLLIGHSTFAYLCFYVTSKQEFSFSILYVVFFDIPVFTLTCISIK